MTIEIVDFPIKMVIFHSYVNVYQRVDDFPFFFKLTRDFPAIWWPRCFLCRGLINADWGMVTKDVNMTYDIWYIHIYDNCFIYDIIYIYTYHISYQHSRYWMGFIHAPFIPVVTWPRGTLRSALRSQAAERVLFFERTTRLRVSGSPSMVGL